MSDVLQKMETRRSIRKFKGDMVPQDIMDKIIEAGLYAASGHGEQNTIMIQVTNKEMRDKISQLNCQIGGWKEGFDPFYGAPAMIIVLAKKSCLTGFMMAVWLWEILCWPPMSWALAAAGFTEPRKNLKWIGARSY